MTTMLGPGTLSFLRDLAANNSREWFTDNRSRYETCLKLPAEAFADRLCDALEQRCGMALVPKIYRIHRDLRYAKDKTPYNAHLHISFTPREGPDCAPGWMFGLEPGRLVLGAGIMAFGKPLLDAWRAYVAGPEGAKLSEIVLQAVATGARIDEPELKRVPVPWPADHPCADLLERKSLTVWRDCKDPSLCFGADGPQTCASELTVFAELFLALHRIGARKPAS